MRTRLDSIGYYEANVTKTGEKRITVEIPEVTEDVAVSDDEVQLSDGDDIVLDDIQLDIGLEEGEEKQKSEPEVSEDIVISDDAEMDIDEAMSGQVFEDEELSDLDFVTDAQAAYRPLRGKSLGGRGG